MGLGLENGTATIAGRVETRPAGDLRLSAPRELLVTRGIRAAFEPGGGLAEDTIRWWGSGEGSAIDDVPAQMPEMEIVDVHEEEVIWGGCVVGHFGHFLIESVSRLWPLLPGGPCEGASVVFTTPVGPRFTAEWLQAFGTTVFDLPSTGAVRFTNVRVPEPAWRIDAYVAPEVREIHRKAREGLAVPTLPDAELIWLSRSEIEHERRVRDEALLEWLLERHVSVVHPEQLTLAEQVGTLESAAAVTGTIGSAFHTLLMAERQPRCVYLTPARVASTFLAQEWLLDGSSQFIQTLSVERMELRRPKRREGHRLLIPEALRSLTSGVISDVLEDPLVAAAARPELPAARIGERGGGPGLEQGLRGMLLDSHSIEARMSFGVALEEAGLTGCVLEQYNLVVDWTEGYAYGPLRAARLLVAIGEIGEAARMARIVLAIDPDSDEAAGYVALERTGSAG